MKNLTEKQRDKFAEDVAALVVKHERQHHEFLGVFVDDCWDQVDGENGRAGRGAALVVTGD